MMKNNQNKLIVFESKKIRRIWHEDEWYYSIIDICGALTDSQNPRDYWYRIKKRVGDEEKMELSTICRQLKLDSSDGKKYNTDCANTGGIRMNEAETRAELIDPKLKACGWGSLN